MHKKKTPKTIKYNSVNDPKRMHGYRNVRWIENASCGLRLVGFADEVARDCGRHIDHKGWFTTDDNYRDEVFRGVVYQLPSRDGETQYVSGYADPNNDDCALLCFDPVTDKTDAAHQADRFAELMAETERDYQRAWGAGRRYEDLADEIKTLRHDALSLGAEMREARKLKVQAPRICATLRDTFLDLYRQIQKLREERAELLNNFGEQEGFAE